MDALPEKKKSKLVRYSFRTMLIFVTLFCIYFGCWPVTKSQGAKDVAAHIWGPDKNMASSVAPIAPLLLKTELWEEHRIQGKPKIAIHSTYYLWCLGYVAKVPYTTLNYKDYQ